MDFDPEFAGDETTIRLQRRILAEARRIAATQGLASRGGRISFLDAWRHSPQLAVEIVREFETAVFFLRPEQQAEFTSPLEQAGICVHPLLLFSSADAVFSRAATILAEDLPTRHRLTEIRIDAHTSPTIIAGAQQLMATCGLPTMPGYFIRGLTQANVSVALRNQQHEVVGFAIGIDDSIAGPDFAGWYFPSTICVAPDLQGRALGRWLNARVIQIARSTRRASFIHEGVSAGNVASQRMIASCGLSRVEDRFALLATAIAIPKAWH